MHKTGDSERNAVFQRAKQWGSEAPQGLRAVPADSRLQCEAERERFACPRVLKALPMAVACATRQPTESKSR